MIAEERIRAIILAELKRRGRPVSEIESVLRRVLARLGRR